MCIATNSFSQTSDEIANDTTMVDSIITTTENYVDEENSKQVFNNSKLDTAMVVARLPINDTIAKLKKLEEYHYPIEANNSERNISNTGFWNKLINALSGETANYIIWTIIILFMIVVVILYAINNNIGVFVKRGKSIANKQQDELQFNNIFNIDYETEIIKATSNNNFNLAARLGFLRLLTQLSSKKIINYSIEKTNFDYQLQLINTNYYRLFLLAVNNYEYAWFSGNALNERQYKQVVNNYNNLELQLTY